MRILLVDDEHHSRGSVAEFLSELGHQVDQCDNAKTALETFSSQKYPLVITDIRMPGMDGIEFLKEVKSIASQATDVIVYTGHGDVATAISALRLGAYDYLQKPINVDELALLVERSAEHQQLLREREQLATKFDESLTLATNSLQKELERTRDLLANSTGLGSFIAHSEVMRKVTAQALVFHSDPSIPIMIEGETGTGKEMIARLIHFGRAGNSLPLVDINCAALSAELFESELFGYEPGAFTGGKPKGEQGKMALSGDGTLFLDEIGDMPLNLQPKLLRVLQDRTYYPVGGLKKQNFSARIICATNRSLQSLVESNHFRRDLFYRLNVGYIYLPPLRKRPEEIVPLATFFLKREANIKKKNFLSISPEAQIILRSHHWPGNVRELENTIERAVLCWNHSEILPEHLDFLAGASEIDSSNNSTPHGPLNLEDIQLPEQQLDLEALNQAVILKALARFKGNKTHTANYLGISRNALYTRLNKLNNKT